jgi:hypothetical protein
MSFSVVETKRPVCSLRGHVVPKARDRMECITGRASERGSKHAGKSENVLNEVRPCSQMPGDAGDCLDFAKRRASLTLLVSIMPARSTYGSVLLGMHLAGSDRADAL